MFNRTTLERNNTNGVITIKGDFKSLLDKRIVSKTKGLRQSDLDLVFDVLTKNTLSFYEFFAIEVVHILEAIAITLDKNNSFFMGLFNLRSINAAIKLINTETWYKDIDMIGNYEYDKDKLDRVFKFQPLKYQEKWFQNIMVAKTRLGQLGSLLQGDAGTGKTYMSLATSELLDSQIVICIVPLEAMETVWVKSLTEDLYREPQRVWTTKSKKQYDGEKFIIAHYEGIKQLMEILPYIKGRNSTTIIDELHNLNDLSRKRTEELMRFMNAAEPTNVIPMSGTPIKAASVETVVLFKLIDKKFNFAVEKRASKLYSRASKVVVTAINERFEAHRVHIPKERTGREAPIYDVIPVKVPNGQEFTLEAIAKESEAYFMRRSKELENQAAMWSDKYHTLYVAAKNTLINNGYTQTVFSTYEKNVETVRTASASHSLQAVSDIIVKTNAFERNVLLPTMGSEEKKIFREAKTIYKYPQLKIHGEILGKVIGGARIRCHKAIAAAIDYDSITASTDAKIVIFSNHIEVANTAVERLNRLGYKPLTVYGETKKHLPKTVSNFMEPGNGFDHLVTTYKSLSAAVPLIAANVEICIDLPFRSYTYEQAVSRIDREGQTRQTYVYTTSLDTGDKPNISDRTIDILKWSSEMVKIITGTDVSINIIERELGIQNEDVYVLPTMSTEHAKEKDIVFSWETK